VRYGAQQLSALSKTSYFFRTAVGSLARAPFVHSIAVASLSLALIGFGIARLARWQLDSLLGTLVQDVELTVYLEPDATDAQVEALQNALKEQTRGTIRKVSASEALARLASDFGQDTQWLSEVGDNVLPNSLELKLPRAENSGQALSQLVERTRSLQFVNAVDFSQNSVEKVEALVTAFTWAALLAFGLVFLTAVVVVSATLQLAIFSRRDEIEIQKLVGATDIFVRVPFLLEGLLQGILASVLAALVLAVALAGLASWRAQSFGGLGGTDPLRWRQLLAEVFALGTTLGLTGSFIAVRRFLRV
jgi:cell division transport system permease protein